MAFVTRKREKSSKYAEPDPDKLAKVANGTLGNDNDQEKIAMSPAASRNDNNEAHNENKKAKDIVKKIKINSDPKPRLEKEPEEETAALAQVETPEQVRGDKEQVQGDKDQGNKGVMPDSVPASQVDKKGIVSHGLGGSRVKTGMTLEREPEPDYIPGRPVLVEFRDIVKRYGHHLVLDHVDLKLYKGEFLSIVGPSGAGKSTLIKCLTLQERPDIGHILVAGRDITMLRTRELPFYRRKVGIVFQDFKLLPSKTVYENVAFALEVSNTPTKQIKQRVELILETVGMLSKRDNFPNELSGGEQQRAAIARALVHDPKILIADEPTGNLDPVNTWEIIELLFKINKSGTMVILATHDREIVDALKKRVITVRAGRVVSDQEKGTYLV